jgi:DNA end-binding protein Ku
MWICLYQDFSVFGRYGAKNFPTLASGNVPAAATLKKWAGNIGVCMAPHAQWKGYLRLSLVSCPIALFPASSAGEKIHFNQINKNTGHRIRMMRVDAETGEEVDKSDIVKGYKVGKDRYVEITSDELEAVQIESTRTIDIDRFVPRSEIDDLYIEDPYCVVPDGKLGAQAFAVIREAVGKKGMVALGRVVFSTREHVIGLEPRGKGLLGFTLRYPYEIRKERSYFDDIPNEKTPKEMIDLATHIIEQKSGRFEPQDFHDQYESALRDIIRKKMKGQKITPEKLKEPSNVINLMDALKRSVRSQGEGGKQARSRNKAPKRGAMSRKKAKAS